MSTLLMRLRAPMMSWGDHSRFTIRDSRREPTKSAVLGILCAALGRPRSESVGDLAALKMGVRINQSGVMQCDYHTVQYSIRSRGKPGDTVVSYRYFMADADYLVGLEGELTVLNHLDQALENPVWQIYFGRKSFVPSCPVRVKVVEQSLLEALRQYPYTPPKRGKPLQKLPYILETDDSLDVRQDVPLDWIKRTFGSRCVETVYFPVEG